MSWRKLKISEFLKERPGRYKPDDIDIVGLKRLEKIDFSGNIHISDKSSRTNMILIKQGDLVISGINVYKGALAIYQGSDDICATIHYSSYRYNPDLINIDFLKWFLKSKPFLQSIQDQVPGGIKTEIKPKHLLPLEVRIPNLKEQSQIVHYLYRLSKNNKDLVSEIEYQHTLITKLKQSILQDAISGKLTEQWRKENLDVEPASELLKRIKTEKEQLIKEKKIKKEKLLPPITKDEIPFELPEGWVWCRLGEITTLITDGKHGDCQNELNSGYYFLSAKDIQNGTLNYQNARQITYNDFLETHRRTNLMAGDLCIVNTGATIGKTALASNNEITRKTTFQKSVAVIKTINKLVLTSYLEKVMIYETPNLLKTSRGSAINNLLLGDIKKLLIALPPTIEQIEIIQLIERLFKICNLADVQTTQVLKDTELLMQSVLKEAFEE